MMGKAIICPRHDGFTIPPIMPEQREPFVCYFKKGKKQPPHTDHSGSNIMIGLTIIFKSET